MRDEMVEACCPIGLRERLLVRGWGPLERATGPKVPIDLNTPLPGARSVIDDR